MTIKRRYAPDTNFFLQFKGAEELPWGDLTGEAVDEVELIVLLEVARELDHHKEGGNGRRVKRARKFLSQLRPLLLGTDEIVVCEAGPRVSYRLAPVLSAERQRHELLDHAKADCRIVGEAMACSRELYNGELALVSHDMGPISYARAIGLKYHLLPNDWLLAPETDEAEKENKRLSEKIKSIEGAGPKIDVGITFDGVTCNESIQANVISYEPLSSSFVNHVMTAVERKYISLFSLFGFRNDLASFMAHVAIWRLVLERHIKKIPDQLNSAPAFFVVSIDLRNRGRLIAEQLEIKISAEGGIKLFDVEEHDKNKKDLIGALPQPPSRNSLRERWSSASKVEPQMDPPFLPSAWNASSPSPPKSNRHFEWILDTQEGGTGCLTGRCVEFRHGVGHEKILLGLQVNPEAGKNITGRLVLHGSARNMPEVYEQTWRVRVSVDTGDSTAEVRSVLKRDLDIDLIV